MITSIRETIVPILVSDVLSPLSMAAMGVTLMIAAWTDWTSWRIPNKLLAASLAAALLIAGFSQNGIGLGDALLGGLLGLAVFMPVYLFKGIGAADVKLMAVIGTYAGPALTFNIVLAAALIGGVWAVLLWDLNRGGLTLWLRAKLPSMPSLDRARWLLPVTSRITEQVIRQKMPYGVVIALGTALTLALAR